MPLKKIEGSFVMINKEKLLNVIEEYKKVFKTTRWKSEKFKWVAVKHFQDHWDINAADFSEMFLQATHKASALLKSMSYFPRGMIKAFAGADPEATRGMFINLFDETKNLGDRIDSFQIEAEKLRSKYGADDWKSHYQNANSISTYLWLRYPDKYYIYKHNDVLAVANELESDFIPKRGVSTDNVIGAIRLYNEICVCLILDDEMADILKSSLTENCYPDPSLKTLTIDIGSYISKVYSQKAKQPVTDWFPADYTPGFTVEDWTSMLNDPAIFNETSLKIMKRFYDYGGAATCKQLSVKYGESPQFYNMGSTMLAKRIAEKTNCPLLPRDSGKSRFWTVLYLGRKADGVTEGSWVWKLRDELAEALKQFDLSKIDLYAKDDDDQNYWWLNANPLSWSSANIKPGEKQSCSLYDERGNERRIFQNFLDAKSGDLTIVYESDPANQIVALARVTDEDDDENLHFEKTEGLCVPFDYDVLKNCPELSEMEFFADPDGSFFKLTKGEYEFIMGLIPDVNPTVIIEEIPVYTKEDFLNEVYMSEDNYDTLRSLLEYKKNIILQGPPGVGKTFAAKRLVYSIMGQKDNHHIEFIQFHQNYSYEDFIMGYKPEGDGFELKHGVFYRFCQKASTQPDKPFFFIIDEINRGNMSKIFGELLMLIEKDYRNTEATLAYSGLPFSVPENVYLIGMMNTADRSLAMIDYALRRRFSFVDMEPGFNSDGFKKYQKECNSETFDSVITQIAELNRTIAADKSLGKGFCIGHSYFCGNNSNDNWLSSVIEYEIIPMLNEYWFDDSQKIQHWTNLLRGAFYD